MLKKIIKWVGNILVLLSIVFIVYTILKFDVDYKILANPKMLISILILSLISSVAILLDSIAGKYMINDILKVSIPFKNIYEIYSKSNIGKYLPGNVMHYVSRGIYCKEYNISTGNMYYVTILEILLKVMTAFLITLFLVKERINDVFKIARLNISINNGVLILLTILLVLILFGFILYKERNLYRSFFSEVKMIKPIIMYTITFLINSLIFIITIYLIDNSITNGENIFFCIGVYTMAWLIGYVTPGAPGGIGIKETIILVSLSPIYGENVTVLAAVIVRVINVLGDIFAYLINILFKLKSKNNI